MVTSFQTPPSAQTRLTKCLVFYARSRSTSCHATLVLQEEERFVTTQVTAAQKTNKMVERDIIVAGLPCGYEYEFISSVFEEYHCHICHLPLREPVLTRCGHRYCKKCLDEAIKRYEEMCINISWVLCQAIWMGKLSKYRYEKV